MNFSKIKYLVFLLVMQASSSYAYSPAAHKLMAIQAVENFNYCVGVLDIPISAIDSSQLKKIKLGTLLEDINPIGRAKHYHFYRPGRDLGKGFWGIGKASLTGRYVEVEKKLKASNKFKSLGALTHYIQDVTNPAHVAPVFHGAKDGFDTYDFEANWPEKISAEKCRELHERAASFKKSGVQSTFGLLNEVSVVTLEKMQEKILISSEGHQGFFSWEEAFWNSNNGPESKLPTFGQYGFLGNTFGKPESVVNPAIEAKFATERVNAALDATVLLFMMSL